MDTTSFTKKSLGLETVEPALTPPPANKAATLPKKPKMGSGKSKKRDIPEGLWTKCPKCATMVFDKELDENLKVCPKCGHHFPIGSRERIHSLVETCTFEEMDAKMTSADALSFTGVATYTSKLEAHQKRTSLTDAVVTGLCKIGEHRAALGVMDFSFLGGSMGAVVGEKLTRLIERATEKELPAIIISSSGGARMYEGMFSLMQMAKTSGRDGQLREPGRPDSGRAGRDDWFRRPARHQGHNAERIAAGLPDRRISPRPRPD
jgi:acetyl-CoA carboxylase carboxyl transferase subunit beta